MTEENLTVKEALQITSVKLGQAGIDSCLGEAGLLLSSILDCTRSQVHLNRDYVLSYSQMESLKLHVEKREKRVPLQYITEQQSFRYLNIKVDQNVFIPRPETELLAETVIRFAELRESPTVVDLGTGSAAIALSVACEVSGARVFAVDISPLALKLAYRNVSDLGLQNRVRLVQSDLFEDLEDYLEGKVDAVVSNPPYISSADIEQLMPEVRDFEPRIALDGGEDGLDVVRKLISQTPEFLKPGGLLALEIGYGQADKVRDLLETTDAFGRIKVLKDYSGIDRIIRAILR